MAILTVMWVIPAVLVAVVKIVYCRIAHVEHPHRHVTQPGASPVVANKHVGKIVAEASAPHWRCVAVVSAQICSSSSVFLFQAVYTWHVGLCTSLTSAVAL